LKISICIVSRNRKLELKRTLEILHDYTEATLCEILVFLDGCSDDSKDLVGEFPECIWEVQDNSIGASPARNLLYQKATGDLIFGFDDDAHPLQNDFINKAQLIFSKNEHLAVLAFEEIKGVFDNDAQALEKHIPNEEFYCREFVGCGFVIKKEAYKQTAGFPNWMKIYGEESCLSIELLDLGYAILYTSQISVNHRVNKEERKHLKKTVYRFENQLSNSALFYFVYYPKILIPKRLTALLFRNFRKYAFEDILFFKAFFRAMINFLIRIPKVITYRKVVKKETLKKSLGLPLPKYG